jgi:hypothetical protein
MFSPGNKRFDPFNISNGKGKAKQGIKFERMTKTVKTKPLWWLIAAFLLVSIVYWYLSTKVL